MFNWFKRKKSNVENSVPVKITMKPFVIHPKETMAWIAAQEGNTEILAWLRVNRIEIFHAIQAIKLEDDSRTWLAENGFPQLIAMINAAEGDEKALKWLQQFKMDDLYHMAMAIEDEQDSWTWLKTYSTEDIFLLTHSIKKIKDAIEFNHNDIHSINKD